jgi:hypothetical protein
MRRRLCEAKVVWYLNMLCPHKACVFYDQLREVVMPSWLKDETVNMLDMGEKLANSYLVS